MKRSLRDNEYLMKGGFIIGNLILLIAGGGVLGIGSWMVALQSDIYPLLGSRLYLFFAILYVITSSFMLLVFLYGGISLKWNSCLPSYWKFLLAASVCVLGIGLLSFTFSYDMETSFRLKMYPTRHEYGQDITVTEAWDSTQKNLMCCGIISPDDWIKECDGCIGKLPSSCCEDGKYCHLSDAYQTGCHEKLHIKVLLYVVGAVAFFSYFVMLLTMWFALSYIRIQRYERI